MIVFDAKLFRIQKLVIDSNLIFAIVRTHERYFILGLVYFSTDLEFSSLFDALSLTLNSLAEKYPDLPLVIGGDFNCRVAAMNQLDPLLFGDSCLFSAGIFRFCTSGTLLRYIFKYVTHVCEGKCRNKTRCLAQSNHAFVIPLYLSYPHYCSYPSCL